MTNFENGVWTPFIIRAPGIQPASQGGAPLRTVALAEAVDMYRCDMNHRRWSRTSAIGMGI